MKRLTGLVVLLLPIGAWADVVGPIESVENFVNIRMSADSKSEVVGRLRQGDYIALISTDEDWYEVEIAGGASGFVSADWVVVHAETPAAEEGIDVIVLDGESAAASTADSVADVSDAEVTDDSVSREAEDETELAVVDTPIDALAEQVEAEGSVASIEADTIDVLAQEDETGIDEISADIAVEVAATENLDSAKELVSETDKTAETDVEFDEAGNNASEEPGDTAPVVADVVADVETLKAPSSVSVDEQSVAPEATESPGLAGPPGPQGEPGPPGPPGAATIEGAEGFLARFSAPTVGESSQIYDDGNNIGIGTTTPVQRLEVNGNIQIHERNSSVAGLMITQSDGETGYIMHNRASTLTIGAGSIDRITVDGDGNVGFSVARPAHPIEMASGAHVTAGGVWTNSSSRSRKENIATLSADDALAALTELQPVQYNYKNDQVERYVGFIAEDVPDLVATTDRDGLSAMDIVAVLTKVVQEQQQQIEALEARLDQR